MRTPKQPAPLKVPKKRAKEYARLWAAAQLRTFTKDDIIKRLYRFRTFYAMGWENALAEGQLVEAEHFCTMITRLTELMTDVAAEQTNQEIVVTQKVMRIPLMLAPMESLDFTHMLDPDNGGRDDPN